MTAGRERDAVLLGEPLEIVARDLAMTASDLSLSQPIDPTALDLAA